MDRKKFILPIALVVSIAILNEVNVANAAYVSDNNAAVNQIMEGLSGGGGGFGTIFQTQLGNLAKGLLSAAKVIAVIMTAVAGFMICFGIENERKVFLSWILGIGLAINFGDLILNLWSVQDVSSPSKIDDYKLLLKSADDPSIDILSPFMRYYIGVIMSGASAVAPYAINLTLILALIDGAIKVSMELIHGDKIIFFVSMILKVGFFIFLIQSWVGTNSNFQLMPALSSGFETLGLYGRRCGRNDKRIQQGKSRFKYRGTIESNSDERAKLLQYLLGTRTAEKFADDTGRIDMCSNGGDNFIFNGVGNVYGKGRILDNGINNHSVVTVRSN